MGDLDHILILFDNFELPGFVLKLVCSNCFWFVCSILKEPARIFHSFLGAKIDQSSWAPTKRDQNGRLLICFLWKHSTFFLLQMNQAKYCESVSYDKACRKANIAARTSYLSHTVLIFSTHLHGSPHDWYWVFPSPPFLPFYYPLIIQSKHKPTHPLPPLHRLANCFCRQTKGQCLPYLLSFANFWSWFVRDSILLLLVISWITTVWKRYVMVLLL